MLRIIGILIVGIVSFSASLITLAKLNTMSSTASVVSVPSPSPSPMASINPVLPEPSARDTVVSLSPTATPKSSVWVRSRREHEEDEDDD